ncbi:MAG: hypothetical protein DRJ29_09535, partial [Bacteroidetes bacterium]
MMKDSGPFDPDQFGKLSNRISELENRISSLEKRSASQDPEGIYRTPIYKEQSDAQELDKPDGQNEA